MEEVTNTSIEAIDRYFNSLLKLGYLSYKNVNQLMALLIIEELLSSEFQFYVTENDYNIINKALYCLYGSNCMIEYPKYNNYDELIHNIHRDFIPRITLDNTLRFDEEIKIKC